jgi:membrane associated rhomboid family serine protease
MHDRELDPYREDMRPAGEPPAFNVPGIVLALIVALVGTFAVLGQLSEAGQENVLLLFALFPARLFPPSGMPDVVFPGGAAGDIWTLFSYTFLHGSWTHVAVNAVWLLAFGSPVARRLGAVRFLLFYFFCGLGGAFAHILFHQGSLVPVVGASAAISGLMGGAARFVFLAGGPLGGLGGAVDARGPRQHASIGRALSDRRVIIFVAVWIGLNFLFGPTGLTVTGETANIAWEAHLGGFLAGLLFFGFFDPFRASPSGGPGNVGYGEWSGRRDSR